MEMKSVLLARVLALLWVSAAWAEVLVQPDFDAKKVPEASVQFCRWGWAGPLPDPTAVLPHAVPGACKPFGLAVHVTLKPPRGG